MDYKKTDFSIAIGDELANNQKKKKSSFTFFAFLIIACTILVLVYDRNLKKDEGSSNEPQNVVVNYFFQNFFDAQVESQQCDGFQVQIQEILEDFYENFPIIDNFNANEDFKDAVLVNVQRAADQVALGLNISPLFVSEYLVEGSSKEIEFPLSCFSECFNEIRNVANEALKVEWKEEEDEEMKDYPNNEISIDSNDAAEVSNDDFEDLVENIFDEVNKKLDDLKEDSNDVEILVVDLQDQAKETNPEQTQKDSKVQDVQEVPQNEIDDKEKSNPEQIKEDSEVQDVQGDASIQDLKEILQNEIDNNKDNPQEDANTLIDELKEILDDSSPREHKEFKREAGLIDLDQLKDVQRKLDKAGVVNVLLNLQNADDEEENGKIAKRQIGSLDLDMNQLQSLVQDNLGQTDQANVLTGLLLKTLQNKQVEDHDVAKREAGLVNLDQIMEINSNLNLNDAQVMLDQLNSMNANLQVINDDQQIAKREAGLIDLDQLEDIQSKLDQAKEVNVLLNLEDDNDEEEREVARREANLILLDQLKNVHRNLDANALEILMKNLNKDLKLADEKKAESQEESNEEPEESEEESEEAKADSKEDYNYDEDELQEVTKRDTEALKIAAIQSALEAELYPDDDEEAELIEGLGGILSGKSLVKRDAEVVGKLDMVFEGKIDDNLGNLEDAKGLVGKIQQAVKNAAKVEKRQVYLQNIGTVGELVEKKANLLTDELMNEDVKELLGDDFDKIVSMRDV